MDKKPSGQTVNTEKKGNLKSDSHLDKKHSSVQIEKSRGEIDATLGTVEEVNEPVVEDPFADLEIPQEWGEYVEDPPKIYSLKDIKEPLTIESLNNAIYELGVINLCWPEITEPVFENRTCFPESYYTNTPKERLLLAYAESLRRQYFYYYRRNACYRKPLLLQAPNECGIQKMVCTTIRVTKLCFTGTNTWKGIASLVGDYFTYEPLTKPMLHPDRIMSPYTALVRRSGNPFEIAHVLVSWLLGAGYEAYVVIGCASRDICLNIRYRDTCPDIPDETPVVEEVVVPDEQPRYRLVPLPDFNSKYVAAMIEREKAKIQEAIDEQEAKRQKRIAELEQPPEDPIDGFRTHAWVLVMPSQMLGVEEPFFIEPSQGNAYPLSAPFYQQIDAVYNNENYYVNIQSLKPLEEEEEEEEEEFDIDLGIEMSEHTAMKKKEYMEQRKKEEAARKKAEERKKGEEADKERREKEGKARYEELEKEKAAKKGGKKVAEGATHAILKQALVTQEEEENKKKKKKKKKKEEEKVEEEENLLEEEEPPVQWEDLSYLSYDFSDMSCWEHLLAGEPESRRQFVGVDIKDKRTAVTTEKHLDVPTSWVEKLDITSQDFEQRYPGCYKRIHYKRAVVEKFSRYSQNTGIIKRVVVYEDYALTKPLVTYEYYSNRDDLMTFARIDHVKKEVREEFETGRTEHMIRHVYSLTAPPQSIEGHRTMEFKWYARLDHLEKIVCTPLTFDEFYRDRVDRLESRTVEYTEGTKLDPKRNLLRVTEIYGRNPDVLAGDDVWKRIFHIQKEDIELQFHYAYNFFTNDTRYFNKPNLAETGGKILFYPDKTSGYVSCPCGKPTRPLKVYCWLCENMEWENRTTKHIREAEADTNNYLQQRFKELTEPTLYVSLFSTEMNKDAQKEYFEQEQQKAEMKMRAREADIDPLQPYLARMFGVARGLKQPLSIREATILREQCINDFKAKQLARQCLVQERFDALNTEYKAKRLWYLANQFILTPEKEAAYFQMSAELSFQVHTLEVRLTRHMDLSHPRFKVIEDYLNKHPLLAEYNRARTYYRGANK